MRHRGLWNDDTVATLKQLRTEGLSASRCALRLGNGLTRNAILGKIHRMNGGDTSAWSKMPPEDRERIKAARRALRIANGLKTYGLMAVPPTLAPLNGKARHMLPRLWKARHAPPVARPKGKPVPITEATGCRYIEGNDRLCCNAPGVPWCSYHAAIVWGPL